MCQMGNCTNTATVLIEAEETDFVDFIAVCDAHVPADTKTFPIGQVY